ncbi:MAG: hypothetical protein WCF98_08905 [Synechococcus sp. ELA057]
MASFVYDSVLNDVARGNIDFDSDSYKILLVTSSYTASKTAHAKRSSVTNEITGTGYTAGGAAIVCTLSDDTAKKILTFASTSWATATFTAAAAVIYKARGGASSADELIAYLDFSGSVSASASTFSVSATVITLSN